MTTKGGGTVWSQRIVGGILVATLMAAFVLIPTGIAEAARSPYCALMQKYCPALYAIYCK